MLTTACAAPRVSVEVWSSCQAAIGTGTPRAATVTGREPTIVPGGSPAIGPAGR